MKNQSVDPNALPCMVLTFSPEEMEFVNQTLDECGYEGDLKQWILDNMMSDEEGPSRYEGAADRVISNVASFVQDNPATIQAAGRFASALFKRTMKKGPQ